MMLRWVLAVTVLTLGMAGGFAQADDALSKEQLIKIFSYFRRESWIHVNQHLLSTGASFTNVNGAKSKYIAFYFKEEIDNHFSFDVFYANIYIGYPFYRFNNFSHNICYRYYSRSFEAYWKKIRRKTPIEPSLYNAQYEHYLSVSEPFGFSCVGVKPDPKRLTLTDVEPIFRLFMREQGLLAEWNYGVRGNNPVYPLSYYAFVLDRSPGKGRRRALSREIWMNSWTGELYEERADNPCAVWSSPALRRAQADLYRTKGLTETDLAPHHAHFRAITDPRSANCLGDRLDGLMSVDEELKAGEALRKATE